MLPKVFMAFLEAHPFLISICLVCFFLLSSLVSCGYEYIINLGEISCIVSDLLNVFYF